MITIDTPLAMRQWSQNKRQQNRTITLVPTMGYLHDGHLALIRRAKQSADEVIVSIYVNPTQFAAGEDLDTYPRDIQGDSQKAMAAGATALFLPTSLYSENYQTFVTVDAMSKPLCGISRPTHFRGVATVVSILFHITNPHSAIFGRKDYQQLAIIRQMTRDLHFGIEIIGHPIVRENDGLARSSRNVYLSTEERTQAVALHTALRGIETAYAQGQISVEKLTSVARKILETYPLARIDYLHILDANNLTEVETVTSKCVVAIAAHLGTTRLIDNIVIAS